MSTDKPLVYEIVMFKMKGHRTWRMTQIGAFVDSENVTDKKLMTVDRITGEVTIK